MNSLFIRCKNLFNLVRRSFTNILPVTGTVREDEELRLLMFRQEKKLNFDEAFQEDVAGSFAIWALPKNTRQHVKFVITPSIQADVLGLVEMHPHDINHLENFRAAIEQACTHAHARMHEKQPHAKLITLIRYDFESWLSSRRISYILPLRALN